MIRRCRASVKRSICSRSGALPWFSSRSMNITQYPIQTSCHREISRFLRDTTQAGRATLAPSRRSCAGFDQLAFLAPALQLHAQSSHPDPQRVRGFDPMPAELLKRAEDHLFFDVGQRLACERINRGAADFRLLEPRLDRRGADHARVCFEYAGALHDVLKLTDIARPVVALQQTQRFGFDVAKRLVLAARDRVEEMTAQFRNILDPLTQRRQLDGHDVEPIEQIAAEFSFID